MSTALHPENPLHSETVRLPAHASGAVEKAVEYLRQGQLIAFPTDTVYGVGAHAFLPQAVGRLYSVKDRPTNLAIPLILSSAELLTTVCTDIPAVAWELARHFWPGALSLVLRRAASVPTVVTAGSTTVAVRVPDHPLALDLCQKLGAPLAATSANLHGHPAPCTAQQVWTSLAGRIRLLLDGGPCPGGTASTVLDLTVVPPVILRPGPVTLDDLADFLALD